MPLSQTPVARLARPKFTRRLRERCQAGESSRRPDRSHSSSRELSCSHSHCRHLQTIHRPTLRTQNSSRSRVRRPQLMFLWPSRLPRRRELRPKRKRCPAPSRLARGQLPRIRCASFQTHTIAWNVRANSGQGQSGPDRDMLLDDCMVPEPRSGDALYCIVQCTLQYYSILVVQEWCTRERRGGRPHLHVHHSAHSFRVSRPLSSSLCKSSRARVASISSVL